MAESQHVTAVLVDFFGISLAILVEVDDETFRGASGCTEVRMSHR